MIILLSVTMPTFKRTHEKMSDSMRDERQLCVLLTPCSPLTSSYKEKENILVKNSTGNIGNTVACRLYSAVKEEFASRYCALSRYV